MRPGRAPVNGVGTSLLIAIRARGTLHAMTERARDRIWVSVHFRCCHQYARVYFRRGETEAQGRCPKCLSIVRFELREDADGGRFFSTERD